MGAQPSIEIIARGNDVRIEDRERGTTSLETSEDPMSIPADMSAGWQIADDEGLPRVFTGGWVGYSGYDTVRYVYSGDAHFSTSYCTLILPSMYLFLLLLLECYTMLSPNFKLLLEAK